MSERGRLVTGLRGRDARARDRARDSPRLDGPDPRRVRARARRDRRSRLSSAWPPPTTTGGSRRAFEHALRRAELRPMRPPELVRTEREITLGTASAGHLDQRLLPMLREAAAVRLAARRSIDIERRPEQARRAARRRRVGAASARPAGAGRPARARASRSAGSAPSSTRWSASDAARRAADAGGAHPRRGRARRRRQARRARADPARPPRRRPRPARGLPRPGEDADRALVRAGDVAPASRASSSRPT